MELGFTYGDGDGDGDGYGYGFTYGYGDGYGCGYGDGSGDGDGYGYGSGDGDGYGSGYGYGDGCGGGYGDGYGDGSGDGSGYGDGDPQFLQQLLRETDIPPGAITAFWRCKPDNSAANHANGDAGYLARVPGYIEEIAGPLKVCTKNALHATHKPGKHKGEKCWLVAMYPPFQTEGDKIGSLKRQFIREVQIL